MAEVIACRWTATVDRTYQASGRLMEKYDVEEAAPGGGGEYPLQDGFGGTNGGSRALATLPASATSACPAKAADGSRAGAAATATQ